MSEKHQFEFDFILTTEIKVFTNNLMKVDDVLKQLHQMQNSKSLNPIKVLLQLELNDLIIIDINKSLEVERIPYNNITNPSFFQETKENHEKYENLVLFIVNDMFEIVPPEFYVFQCSGKTNKAQEFVQKLNLAINNKLYSESKSSSLKKNYPTSLEEIEEQAYRSAYITLRYKNQNGKKINQPLLNSSDGKDQERDLIKLNIYLDLLNRCFDDIEKFITRLQFAADAYHELECRRKNRNGKSGHGDGVIMMKAQPPPNKDFFDIFQKIKLSFNLLVKLKGHIKNPNSPELIHYLFRPLKLAIEASGANLLPGEVPIWERVYTPLLNSDTLIFLSDCLITREVELLRSLGCAWNISSSNGGFWFNHNIDLHLYSPIFYDGWCPPESLMKEICSHHKPNTSPSIFQMLHPFTRDASYHIHQSPERKSSSSSNPSPRNMSPINSNSPNTKNFLAELKSKNAKICIAIEDKLSIDDKDVSILKGQFYEVLEINRIWYKIKNSSGLIGYAPSSKLKPFNFVENSNKTSNHHILNETDFEKIKKYTETGLDIYNEPKLKTTIDNLNDEFQKHVRLNSKGFELDLPKKKLNKTSINLIDKSSTEDVVAWLNLKGFNEKVQQQLGSLTGRELFVLDKMTLEQMFDTETATRLFSQILVQRNLSGFRTMSSKELNAILEQRKKRSDVNISEFFVQNQALTEMF